MGKKIAIGIAAVIILLCIAISLQPDQFSVERGITIAAPAAVPYRHVANFRLWEAWSPWDKLDPQLKREYRGAASGQGAGYSWVGNDDVGAGKMDIEAAKEPESIQIRLEFTEPFVALNTTSFLFTPDGAGTKVTWKMVGASNFMSKAFGLFMNMDKMVGADFEKGLAALKKVAEADAAAPAAVPAQPAP